LKVNFYFDTEFIDNGQTIDLISIGVVNDDGNTFYRVSSEFNMEAMLSDPWLMENVWPFIEQDVADGNVHAREDIARDLLMFVDGHRHIEFRAFCGAYDFVALRQLFGKGLDGPGWLPFYFNEIQSYARQNDARIIRTLKGDERHHALNDAQEVKAMRQMIQQQMRG
jgi:hypothetical protein